MSGKGTRRRVELTDGRLVIRTTIVDTDGHAPAQPAAERVDVDPTPMPDHSRQPLRRNTESGSWSRKIHLRRHQRS